jgi:citrate lyase subunit beta / citryl-CoA lyase
MRLRRSCLAVPGSSPKMLGKARTLPADQVFLDLEDAVAPSEKNDATRQQVVEALHGDWLARTRVVRVNGVATRWCYADVVHIVRGAGAVLDCIMIPKVHDASHVHFVDHLLTQLELELGLEVGRIGLELQIETGHGCVKMEEIAAASPRAETLIFGPGDYAANLGVPQLTVGAIDTGYPGDQWHYINARIVNTARAYGLQAIDGPYAAIRDLEGFGEVARRSRLLGMDGKWALHPDQIAIVNEIYSPDQKQFDLACAILEAYRVATEEQGLGAVMFNGEMIDEASRKMAIQVEASGRAAGMVPTPAPAP